MRIFDPDAENSGYNPYEFAPVNDEPKLKTKDIFNCVNSWFATTCYFVGCLTIGWNLGKLLKYIAGDVNVSFSPW